MTLYRSTGAHYTATASNASGSIAACASARREQQQQVQLHEAAVTVAGAVVIQTLMFKRFKKRRYF
jgi:hypothetical protein